jgi:hypothetical protein
MLNIQFQDEDIDVFVSLLNKLLVASKQTGFNKPFNTQERILIETMSNNMGLNNPEEIRIQNEIEQVKSTNEN